MSERRFSWDEIVAAMEAGEADARHATALRELCGAQDAVAEAVAARGYRDGWTDAQFAARQVCKLVEEVGEMAAGLPRWGWATWAETAGVVARSQFDRPDVWTEWEYEVDVETLRQELADVQVVVFTLAEALGMDVVAAAVEKARRDVERGVRNGDQG